MLFSTIKIIFRDFDIVSGATDFLEWDFVFVKSSSQGSKCPQVFLIPFNFQIVIKQKFSRVE